MKKEIAIRAYRPPDLEAALEIYRAAFPEENLLPLVEALTGRPDVHAFAAVRDGRIVGHVAFTLCRLEGDERRFALLGPLAAHPDFTRQGVGGRLVRTGIDDMRERGAGAVLVLGDPAYYGRFGFRPERGVQTPYPLRADWAEAWQSVWFSENRLCTAQRLIAPGPWANRSLWN